MDKIFISYRREDTEGFARSLFQSLEGRFGEAHVFMDVEAIGLGMDFVDAIDKSLADCGALLVLIGRDWVNCTDSAGQRRLDKANDFVRIEVAKALERRVRVIPILVKGAQRPKVEELPEDLRSLARLQDLELRHETWDANVDHLADELQKVLGLKRLDKPGPPPDTSSIDPDKPGPTKSRRFMIFGIVGIAILVLGAFIYTAQKPTRNKTAVARVTKPEVATTIPQPAIRLSGLWIDDDGARVNFSQTGKRAVSQAIDPETGDQIKANWRIDGRTLEFSWTSSSGRRGSGRGVISSDLNSIRYDYVDRTSGLRDTGLLTRSAR